MTREILWIAPKWPFPVDDGARQATTQLLRQLSAIGTRIVLCAIVPECETPDPEQAKRELGVVDVRIVRRKSATAGMRVAGLLARPMVPVTFAPYSGRAVSREIAAIVRSNPAATVVYDGLHAAAWTISEGEPSNPTVYRAHNVERDLWIRGAQEKKGNPAYSAFLRAQAILVGRFETRVSDRARVVFPVSEVDAKIFRGLVPGRRVEELPIGIGATPAQGVSPSGDELLFVGRLDWPPNRDGLRWLLENAWPEAVRRRAGLRLRIVGSGDGTWLEPYRSLPGVSFLGRVDSVAPHYAACAASVVPVFFGSGTRVKAIESSLHGRACLSTAVGVEGIGLVPGETYVRAETAEEWISALASVSSERILKMGSEAKEFVSNRFDPRKVAERFVEVLGEEVRLA